MTRMQDSPMKSARITTMRRKMAKRTELVVIIVLLVVSFAHLVRLLTGSEITIAGSVLPVWTSIIGCFGPALLAFLFWWSRK